MVDGEKTAKARLLAKERQGLDLENDLVEAAGSVSPRSPPLPRNMAELRAKSEFAERCHQKCALPAGRFGRHDFVRVPGEWQPSNDPRAWQLNAPASGLADDPVAFRRALQERLQTYELSIKNA